MPTWIRELLPIVVLLGAIALVLARLPRIELGHSDAFRMRRIRNWLPLGLTYAFLYMGRYNLTVSKGAFEQLAGPDGGPLMGNADFGWIFGIGTYVYGFAFLVNGPLTDRYGGRFSILLGAAGAAAANVAMGACTWALLAGGELGAWVAEHFFPLFATLYAVNMYFQSFGAVAIVKVNAPWFHVRERGVFGAIFGILISLGIYFAYDWGRLILESESLGLVGVFVVPAVLLAVFWVLDWAIVRDTPGEAGVADFDPEDASSGDDGPRLGALAVFRRMLANPVVMTIAGIEFCSGFLRQAIMQWYRTFAKQTDGALGLRGDFVYENWGMLLCCAGILGGVFAGTISDHLFHSRRGPVAAVLYAMLLAGSVALLFTYDVPARALGGDGGATIALVGWLVLFMSTAVIGVHGMLSGTASMDFGGRRNVGVAVGIIDGFVYLGTAAMSVTYAFALPEEALGPGGELVGPATDPANWGAWPLAMLPPAVL
ncbi:MAG TPA: MFS transporter, partial [Planctomycetota bacterium]|nr:MFS transporter [Planctomycetota bacterium]